MDPLMPRLVGAALGILLVTLAMRRLKQPYVVAYLISGVMLGESGFGVFTNELALARVGEVGVILLLFFVGMEVSLSRLLEGWRVAFAGTVLQIAGTLACVLAIGLWLDWTWGRMVLLAFAMSLSSTAIVVSILRSRNALDSPAGNDALGILLVQDVMLVPMLIVIGLMVGEKPSAEHLVRQLFGALFIVLVIWFAIRAEKRPPGTRLRWIPQDHEPQVFFAFVLCLGFSFITGLVGLSTALGAFVAGVLISALRETDWVHRSLEPFRVILVSVFFVSIGMLIDLRFLVEQWLIVGGLLFVALITNTLINAGVLRLFGRTWRESLYVGTLLAQIGEFSFILVSVGLQTSLISTFAYQVTIGVIALSLALSPAWLAMGDRIRRA